MRSVENKNVPDKVSKLTTYNSVFLAPFDFFSRLFSMLDSDFFRTRLDRPKVFIEQPIWIEPATFPNL